MENRYDIGVDIPDVPIARKGKVEIHEKQWIVKRTILGGLIINNVRRLRKKSTKCQCFWFA